MWSEKYPNYEERMKHIAIAAKMWAKGEFLFGLLPKE